MENDIKPFGGKAKSLYILTDDKKFGDSIVQKAKENQYKVWCIDDFRDFLERLKEYRPDAIILDLNYKVHDPYDLLEIKSKDEQVKRIPVLAIYRDGIIIDHRRLASLDVDNKINVTSIDDIVLSKIFEALYKICEACKVTDTTDIRKAVLNNKKILWIEDDKFLGDILQKKFNGMGALVTRAKNGQEATQEMMTNVPDCILLDILLPGMSGLDLLQKIKEDKALKNIPVMILSNMNQPTDLERARLLGANKYLVKATVSLDKIVNEVVGIIR